MLNRQLARYIQPFLSFFVLIVLWEFIVRKFHISPYKFPGPGQVARGLWDLASSGLLINYTIASLYRVTWGYYLAVLTGVPLGLILGVWARARAVLNPLIQFLRPISPLAWIPLALMWFGIGDPPAIFLIFLSSFFPMVVFTMSGVQDMKVTYLRVAENFGLKGLDLYLKVLLPGALPGILVGLRITLGTAWLVIVAAEMIAVKSGLGYLIVDARNSLRMDQVIGGMIVIGIIGLLLDRLIRTLEEIPEARWVRVRQ